MFSIPFLASQISLFQRTIQGTTIEQINIYYIGPKMHEYINQLKHQIEYAKLHMTKNYTTFVKYNLRLHVQQTKYFHLRNPALHKDFLFYPSRGIS